jgi:AI-2 transport protein TqsA
MNVSELTTRVTPSPTPEEGDRSGMNPPSLYALAAVLVITATAWFLLKELAPLMRPLVLAIFLAYMVVPIHQGLARRISSSASAVVIVGGTLVLFWGLAMLVYGSIVDLNADMPRLIDRARRIVAGVRAFARAHLPPGLVDSSPKTGEVELQGWDSVRSSVRLLASSAAGMLTEAFVVGFYLVFLLLEVRRFPRRIRAGFEPRRADAVLSVIARINAATISYLRAKALTSLIVAIPSAIVLWTLGVRYPVMWGVLFFLGNFIPYVGSLIALVFPVLLAFLDLQPIWQPCVVALLLVLIQVVAGYVVEPILTGKAVDLSPLVTLICLAFWGLCWGLTGMLIAVPLTAMLKIIWENTASMRPLAILMAEDDG